MHASAPPLPDLIEPADFVSQVRAVLSWKSWPETVYRDELAAFEQAAARVSDLLEPTRPIHLIRGGKHLETGQAYSAWLTRGRRLARDVGAFGFNPDHLPDLARELRTFMRPQASPERLPRTLASCGVRLVLVRPLPGFPAVAGVTWEETGPVLVLGDFEDSLGSLLHTLGTCLEDIRQYREAVTLTLDDTGMDLLATDSQRRELENLQRAFSPEQLRQAPLALEPGLVPQHQALWRVIEIADRAGQHAGIVTYLARRMGMRIAGDARFDRPVRERLLAAVLHD